MLANLDVQPGGFFSTSVRQFFRTLTLSILSLLVAVSLYATAADSIWLQFFTALTKGLHPIARVKDLTGAGLRKTNIDSLWLELFPAAAIYDSDLVWTGSAEKVAIEVSKDLSFTIDENSLVRIRMLDGKLLLRLSQGSLRMQSETDRSVMIQRGSTIETLEVKAGESILKTDSSFGVQITQFTQVEQVADAVQEKRGKPAPEGDTESDKKGKASAEDTKPGHLPTPHVSFDLPTPKDNTIILMRDQSKPIVIAARAACPDKCKMTIFRDHMEWRSDTFVKGQQSAMSIPGQQSKAGRYDWLFTTETTEFRGHFAVEQYTDENLNQAISNGTPVEIF